MEKKNGLRSKLALSLLAASVAFPLTGIAATQASAAEPVDKTEAIKELLQKLTPEEQQKIKEKAMVDMLMSPDKSLEQVAEDAVRTTVEPQKYQELKKEIEAANITVDDAMKAKDEVIDSPVTPPTKPETPSNQTETPKNPETPINQETPAPAPVQQSDQPVPPVDMPADPEPSKKPAPAFSDIAKVPWAKDAIQTLAAEGILVGVSTGKFAPTQNVTRAQYAHLLIQALKLDKKEPNPPKTAFTDIKANDWFAHDVAVAAKFGIVSGVSKTKFSPNATITREEMAVMTARALEVAQLLQSSNGKLETLAQFKDQKRIASWAQKDVATLTEQKILNGMNGNKFGPKEKANRAQAAVLIHKLYGMQEIK